MRCRKTDELAGRDDLGFLPELRKRPLIAGDLATLLCRGIRREEICLLRLWNVRSRQGVMHFRIKSKRDKIRFVPIHPAVLRLIADYLEIGKHGAMVYLAQLLIGGDMQDTHEVRHL